MLKFLLKKQQHTFTFLSSRTIQNINSQHEKVERKASILNYNYRKYPTCSFKPKLLRIDIKPHQNGVTWTDSARGALTLETHLPIARLHSCHSQAATLNSDHTSFD